MIDVCDKYIIELEAAYGFVHGDGLENVPTLYRVKGFRSLVFDQQGLEKLVPLDQMRPSWWDEAYKKGLDEAWEAASKICDDEEYGGIPMCDVDALFGEDIEKTVMARYTASEALAKLRDYEARKKAEDEAVKVGDEMASLEEPTVKVVISSVIDAYHFSGFGGGMNGVFLLKDWRKTGRHFPEIAAVLEQMKGE